MVIAEAFRIAPGKTAPLAGKLSKGGLRKLVELGSLKATIAILASVPRRRIKPAKLAATLVPQRPRGASKR